MCVVAWAFGGPCLVGVVEEGFAVVGEDDAGWGDGYRAVVLGWWGGGCYFWVADCDVAAVVLRDLDGPVGCYA